DDSLREHLHLQVDDSAMQLARQAVQGQRPQVHISGDTELADTIHWLADNVRWNSEADLARLIGEPAAQRTVQVLRQVRQALQGFVDRIVPIPSTQPHTGEAADTPASDAPATQHEPPESAHATDPATPRQPE
ncbi:MAG: hypothetical protein Q4A11_04975, partial [Brachymonas sp.]|nr:hypothetical protein [Brachymonas sp.]